MASWLQCQVIGIGAASKPERGDEEVKKVECIIQPGRLDEVREGLTEIGISGLTVTEVRGYGRQKGHTELYRGSEYTIDFVPKIKMEIVVVEDMVEQLIRTVIEKSRSGRIGDGKVFVSSVEETVRIRTGERGREAV